MSLMNIFDIASSGMSAQSVRLNTTASNIANAESISSNTDETYRSRQPIFAARFQDAMGGGGFGGMQGVVQAGQGVEVKGIVESDAALKMRYEPSHPYANEDGYVAYPNVNIVEEMTNMISASRSFQTNVDVMNSAKDMMKQVLSLGQ